VSIGLALRPIPASRTAESHRGFTSVSSPGPVDSDTTRGFAGSPTLRNSILECADRGTHLDMYREPDPFAYPIPGDPGSHRTLELVRVWDSGLSLSRATFSGRPHACWPIGLDRFDVVS